MLRKNLALMVLACASFGMHAMEDMSEHALVPNDLGNLTILHDQKGFAVSDELKSQRVQNCFIDKELRGLSNEKLAKYLTAGNYVRLSKTHDGQFALRASGRLDGSGLLGATIGFHIGKWSVWGAGHASILAASAMSGWGCVATFLSLEAQLAVPIEAASNTAGLAMGIIVGAGTGPV